MTEMPHTANAAVVAIDMGYGHLRGAEPLAALLGTTVLHADRPPIGDASDQRAWLRVRQFHEQMSRLSQLPAIGGAVRSVLDATTSIAPLYPYRDLSPPTFGAEIFAMLIRRGLGKTMVSHLEKSDATLVTTFYGPAVQADELGWERTVCVITDTDINRIWVPRDASATRILYCVPSLRAQRRLRSYGVPESRIVYTGFPLPDELVGGPLLSVLKQNLAARLLRLDPQSKFRSQARHDIDAFLGPLPVADAKPPLLTFAVGGAGAQTRIARQFLPSFRHALATGKMRLALVAGVRPGIAEQFVEWIREADMASELNHGIRIVVEADWSAYYRSFNLLLAETDILWTKPSEMVFYAALGLPEILSWPVGVHERYNRRWVMEGGAGFKQNDPRFAGQWVLDWLNDGTLAAGAWSGFLRLPKVGSHRIADLVRTSPRRHMDDTPS
jgi:hypothetical protein